MASLRPVDKGKELGRAGLAQGPSIEVRGPGPDRARYTSAHPGQAMAPAPSAPGQVRLGIVQHELSSRPFKGAPSIYALKINARRNSQDVLKIEYHVATSV